MRGKRSKQYRKLMNQYGMTFGFREPYQVLLDAQIIEDAARFKMDLIGGLERTLHGQVKPSKLTSSPRILPQADRNSDKPMLNSTPLQQRTQKREPDRASKILRTPKMQSSPLGRTSQHTRLLEISSRLKREPYQQAQICRRQPGRSGKGAHATDSGCANDVH
jgi:hypothetical protein